MMSARKRLRPSRMPNTTPSTTPIRKPRTVSSIVVAICSQSGPWEVPSVTQIQICFAMPDGFPQKKGSTTPTLVASSQNPTRTRARATRSTCTWSCRRLRRATALGIWVTAALVVSGRGSASTLSSLIAHQHLLAEIAPDLFVDAREAGVETDLVDLARPGQIDLVDALDGPRSRGQHHDPVRHRDRLLEVVGDEDD